MEAIVLAGGQGTRLRSVVPDLPKCMAPVASRPFLEWQLEMLAQRGFTRAILALGYLASAVISHFGQSFAGMELTPVIEPEPLGTGGAIRNALDLLRTDHAHVLNGDTFLQADIGILENLWAANRQTVVVAREVEDVSRYGRMQIDARGRVTAFGEKSSAGPGLVNAGWYVLGKHELDSFPPRGAFSFEQDYLPSAVRRESVFAVVSSSWFIDIGVPEDYALACKVFFEGRVPGPA